MTHGAMTHVPRLCTCPTPAFNCHPPFTTWHLAAVPCCAMLCPGVEIANRGQIKFSKPTASSCTVTLSISYEVPNVLVPFANVSFGGVGRDNGAPVSA